MELTSYEIIKAEQLVSLAPLFFFPQVNWLQSYLNGTPLGRTGKCQPSGWMTADFVPDIVRNLGSQSSCSPANRILLIMDNHDSHVSLSVANHCRENGIDVLTLQLYCCQELQPLDVMTEELRRKIEENRRKAVERLKARQATSELSVATSGGLASPSVHIEKPIQVNANDSNSQAASETANSSFNFKERIGAAELDESLLTEIVNGVGPKSKAYERHVVEPLFESKRDTQNQEFDDKKLAAAKESVPSYFVVDDNSEGSSKLQLNNSHIDDPLADLDSEDDTRVSAPKKRRVAIIESDSD
ncbi:hypothetical protein QYM36_002991 [Artemia franciscana]|uniref:DDE-1 domain-containing protein n=1 Tax=Artemia franciscana TaxID=6661 RepID=A0AA88LFJ5_ARTSF|nr:hypothetical protein QYM36_002991 [Artemia franciscana]